MKTAINPLELGFRSESQRIRVLVAGIGNMLKGDDGFGGEVVRYLQARYDFPDTVSVRDFGIRADDLARAIGSARDAVFLIDAAPRGDPPGTVYLLELEHGPAADADSRLDADAHSLGPVSVLRLVHELSRSESSTSLYLVGCEPDALNDESTMLSPGVAAAVPCAAELVRSYLAEYYRIHLRKHSPVTTHVRMAI